MIVTVLQNAGSRSARRLAGGLSQALHRPVGRGTALSRKASRLPRYVVNWGVSTQPTGWRQTRLEFSNTPAAVNNCRDKIRTFQRLQGANVASLDFTTEIAAARAWQADGRKIIVRRSTTSHSGHGIVVVREGQAIPQAPLYTKYFRKDAEYRAHVIGGRVVLIQQKRRDREAQQEADEALIRVHNNGWIFTVNALDCDGMQYRTALEDLAIAANNAVGCGHSAVDILVRHGRQVTMVVCEINSAPALEADSTREAYVFGIAGIIQEAEARRNR